MLFEIPGYKAIPKARPRLGRYGNIYSPTRNSEECLAWLFRAAVQEYSPKLPYRHPVRVEIIISSRKTLRGDSDNYTKTVLDALEKAGILENDKLVKELQVKLWTGLSPKLTVEIVPIEPARVN